MVHESIPAEPVSLTLTSGADSSSDELTGVVVAEERRSAPAATWKSGQ